MLPETPPSQTPPTPSISVSASASAETRQAATVLQLAGWVGFWLEGAIALVSFVILLFAIFSRNLSSEANTAAAGFSLLLAGVGILIAGFEALLNFRYTQLARRLRRPEPIHHPPKSDTLRIVHLGLITGLVGLAVGLLGTEIGVGTLLVKSLSQPQGIALYEPDKIIRVLDILVPLINANVLAASFVGVLVALWLTQRID